MANLKPAGSVSCLNHCMCQYTYQKTAASYDIKCAYFPCTLSSIVVAFPFSLFSNPLSLAVVCISLMLLWCVCVV